MLLDVSQGNMDTQLNGEKVKVRVRHVTVLLEKVVGVIVVVDNQMKVFCPGLKPIK